ncbi:hypothetical protein CBR_g36760 [Chara braunii]|nr:hypothetical protein CBR_g36760 [Chara braunii]|eukprot:GBG83144.1 hypothetical protein CBR_g36760 [Chara braunii]
MGLIFEAEFGSPPANRWSNTERAHQTAQVLLRTLIRVERLPDVELAYNSSIHPAIGMSPFEFEHGSPISSPLDATLPRTAESDDHLAFLRRMQELLVKARDQMSKTQIRMSRQANRNRLPCPFRAGDLVWVSIAKFSHEQDISRKLLPKWMGPWRILSAVGDDPEGPSFRIAVSPHLPVQTVFHCSKLAPFASAETDEFPSRRTQYPPSMDGFQEASYIITNRRHGNKETEFLLHFSYCSHKADRWLTRSELQATAPAVLSRYMLVDEGGGVDDMLAERAVDVEAEDRGRVVEPEVGAGDVVVTIWMAGEACCCSTEVIRWERPERDAWRESRVACMVVMRERRVEESAGTAKAAAC